MNWYGIVCGSKRQPTSQTVIVKSNVAGNEPILSAVASNVLKSNFYIAGSNAPPHRSGEAGLVWTQDMSPT